jgi:hypothetical protein
MSAKAQNTMQVFSISFFFYIRGSVHHNLYAYKKSKKMQHQYLDFIARSLYMFPVLSVPSQEYNKL